MSRDYSPMRLNVGNPYNCSSSEDSNSEHSVQSYASSPCLEHPGELPWPYQPQYGYQYASLADNHASQRYSPTSFYKNYQHQSSPSFPRGYVEDGWGHPLDMDTGRSYMSHQAPSPVYSNGHYEYYYNEAPQRSCRVLPAHVRLSRAPSLREYPHHPTRGLPRQVVSEELKSWHQRSQSPRPSSLDRNRQGALRIRNVPGQESPLSLPHHRMFQEQQVNSCSSLSLITNERKMHSQKEGNKIPKLSWFVKMKQNIAVSTCCRVSLGRNFQKEQVCAVWACLRNGERYGERAVSLML